MFGTSTIFSVKFSELQLQAVFATQRMILELGNYHLIGKVFTDLLHVKVSSGVHPITGAKRPNVWSANVQGESFGRTRAAR